MSQGAKRAYGEQPFKNPVLSFQESSEKGDLEALCELAYSHAYGLGGLEKSPEKAVKLYEKLAQEGVTRAQYSLGLCYVQGDGVQIDYQKAYDSFSAIKDNDEFKRTGLEYLKDRVIDKIVENEVVNLSVSFKDSKVTVRKMVEDQMLKSGFFAASLFGELGTILDAVDTTLGTMKKVVTPKSVGQPTRSRLLK